MKQSQKRKIVNIEQIRTRHNVKHGIPQLTLFQLELWNLQGADDILPCSTRKGEEDGEKMARHGIVVAVRP